MVIGRGLACGWSSSSSPGGSCAAHRGHRRRRLSRRGRHREHPPSSEGCDGDDAHALWRFHSRIPRTDPLGGIIEDLGSVGHVAACVESGVRGRVREKRGARARSGVARVEVERSSLGLSALNAAPNFIEIADRQHVKLPTSLLREPALRTSQERAVTSTFARSFACADRDTRHHVTHTACVAT